MGTSVLTKTARTIIASASIAAGGTSRGALDLRTAHGGILTIKLNNGATGPTVAPTAIVTIAHDGGTTPATGAEGAVWKRLFAVTGDSVNNSINQWAEQIGPGVMHLQVEISGHTAQAITAEVLFSEITNVLTS